MRDRPATPRRSQRIAAHGGRSGPLTRVEHARTPGMNVMDRIKAEVEGHPVVLFMKGTPQFPMCGFSSRVVQALKSCGARFHHVNVLEDAEVRANLPRFSNWPTFPQLFVNGELIGGCDIALELHEKGELQRMVGDLAGDD